MITPQNLRHKHYTFITSHGRHTCGSLGEDLGLRKYLKDIGSNVSIDYKTINKALTAIKMASDGIRFANGIVSGLADTGGNPLTNDFSSVVPHSSQSTTNQLGKSTSTYSKTRVHIGKTTNSRIKKIQSGPFVIKEKKTICDSQKDYLGHSKRKLLNIQSGFNEKGYSFLMEDHYLSISDYDHLFEIKRRFKSELNQNTDGSRDIFGCVLSTFNQLKIKNRLDFYSTHVKIHLIKITDLDYNIRSLLEEVTSNSSQQAMDTSGKIPTDLQYTDPKINDEKNRFDLSFITNLACNLTLSSKFNERAKIIKTWSRTLAPSSIWEFDLTTHMGRGIHLNLISDLVSEFERSESRRKIAEVININAQSNGPNATNATNANVLLENARVLKNKLNTHPVGYVICLEYVGDRRASILKNKTGDTFSGYSPCNISLEFKHEISYLSNQEDERQLLVYKNSKHERNFKNELDEIFYPDRAPDFHVKSSDIRMNKGSSKGKTYTLEYDSNVLSVNDDPIIFDDLRAIFKNLGYDTKTMSAEDTVFNFKSEPSNTTIKPEDENDKDENNHGEL
jgi:hypothetical protein